MTPDNMNVVSHKGNLQFRRAALPSAFSYYAVLRNEKNVEKVAEVGKNDSWDKAEEIKCGEKT